MNARSDVTNCHRRFYIQISNVCAHLCPRPCAQIHVMVWEFTMPFNRIYQDQNHTLHECTMLCAGMCNRVKWKRSNLAMTHEYEKRLQSTRIYTLYICKYAMYLTSFIPRRRRITHVYNKYIFLRMKLSSVWYSWNIVHESTTIT